MLPNTEVDGILAYDTNDILQRHPTAPTFYRVYGRAGLFAIHIPNCMLRSSSFARRSDNAFCESTFFCGIRLGIIPYVERREDQSWAHRCEAFFPVGEIS